MTIETLISLAAANCKLPEIAFFTYKGVEIIEFETNINGWIDLVDGRRIFINFIENNDVALLFDGN